MELGARARARARAPARAHIVENIICLAHSAWIGLGLAWIGLGLAIHMLSLMVW